MSTSIAVLRRRIAAVPRNRLGRRKFPRELRAEILEMAVAWTRDGKKVRPLARALDMSKDTLAGWLIASGKKGPRTRQLRRVVMQPAPAPAISIVLPCGARIENLNVAAAAQLAKELR